MRVFDRNHIADILYHTDHRTVARWVGTYSTGFGIGNIMTNMAMNNLVSETDYTFTKLIDGFPFLSQQMKNQPQGSYFPDSGKFCKFIYGIFQ